MHSNSVRTGLFYMLVLMVVAVVAVAVAVALAVAEKINGTIFPTYKKTLNGYDRPKGKLFRMKQ